MGRIEVATDNHQDDRASLFDAYFSSTPERPWLNSLPQVEQLLREMGAACIKDRESYFAGKLSSQDALAALDARAKQLTEIFLGKSDRFTVDVWNSAKQLGKYVAEARKVPPGMAAEILIKDTLITMVTELYGVCDFDAPGVTQEDCEVGLNDVFERYTYLFTGVPYPHSPD